MQTTNAVLSAGIEGTEERTLTLDPAFQGLPDTAHGGTILAVFDALAGRSGPRRLVGLYRRRVPLATRLDLHAAHANGSVACRLLDAAAVPLVEGRVEAATPVEAANVLTRGPEHPLPVSSTCFACGVDNPIGLRLRLVFDDATVRVAWRPGERFAAADGRLAPVALTTMLDEAAFWLGALASGEAGMTTELAVTLLGDVAAEAEITVAGRRDVVRARADDPRYWDTEVVARDAAGRAVAVARITFVAVRGSARKLVAGLLGMNPADVLRRVFPAYTR